MPLNEQAFEYLKKLIADNVLHPDTIYSETKLSKELGISRTPLRDAIHRLVQERYIDIIPSKGFCLHKLSAKDVWDTFQLRSAIECYCTVEISKQSESEKARQLFEKLDVIMEKCREILDCPERLEEFLQYDLSFHSEIIDYFENEELSATFASYRYRISRLALLTLQHPRRSRATFQEHSDILQAMKEGRTSEIYELTLKHTEITKKISLQDLEEPASKETPFP